MEKENFIFDFMLGYSWAILAFFRRVWKYLYNNDDKNLEMLERLLTVLAVPVQSIVSPETMREIIEDIKAGKKEGASYVTGTLFSSVNATLYYLVSLYGLGRELLRKPESDLESKVFDITGATQLLLNTLTNMFFKKYVGKYAERVILEAFGVR